MEPKRCKYDMPTENVNRSDDLITRVRYVCGLRTDEIKALSTWGSQVGDNQIDLIFFTTELLVHTTRPNLGIGDYFEGRLA